MNQLIEQDEDGLVDCKGVSYDPLDSSDIQYTYPLPVLQLSRLCAY